MIHYPTMPGIPGSKKRLIIFFASSKVTVTCLLLMIILIVWGTLYQASEGILAARNRFFHSWYFLTSLHVPMPGLKLISVVLTLNLLAGSVRFFKKPLKNSGLLCIHCGVILLLTGMLFSSQFTREYFISLQQGETASHAYSTELSEIALYKKNSHELALYTTDSVMVNDISSGQQMSFPNSNVQFIVKDVRRKNSSGGQQDITVTIIPDKDCRTSTDKEIVLKNNNQPLRMLCVEDTVYISLRPVSIPLPVRLHLLHFSTQFHPGTDMLKGVRCEMAIHDGELRRKTEIAMNKPFRYGSYTFYQASYSNQGTRPITSLSVIYNPHRLFPYIASILLISGFIFHFVIMITKKIIEQAR